MSSLTSEETLYQKWMLYMSKNDTSHLKDYINTFLDIYKKYIDIELSHISDGFTSEAPHSSKLPESLLQVIGNQLLVCAERLQPELSTDTLAYAQQLTQCLIIICRNLDNIALVASCEYVTHVVSICTAVLNRLSQNNAEDVVQLTGFVNHACHFFECIYDPYFMWRKQLTGNRDLPKIEDWWDMEKSRLKFPPAVLHVEVVPFFYECFQHNCLDVEIQGRLLHVFGAIITGSQVNALKAICPATLDVLLKILAPVTSQQRSVTVGDAERHDITGNSAAPPGGDARQNRTLLHDLVLKCMVRTVHVVHCCSPDQRQVEVGAVLEGYFNVLRRSAEVTIDLNLTLNIINSMHEMLHCHDKPALQVIFVAEGAFETFLKYLQQVAKSGLEAQSAGMAVIRVMNNIMAGSTVAKEKFAEKVGYVRFVEALRALGQPYQELVRTLVDMVIEDVYQDWRAQTHTIRNAQALHVLLLWLPDIQSQDIQNWLVKCLSKLCCQDNRNRMQCCKDGVISALLMAISQHDKLSSHVVGELISILESLGTMSITAAELKHLISLLKPDADSRMTGYSSRLMHALSVMARKDGRTGALNYFDLTQPNAGITLPGVRKWPGAGFSFHAWVCLEKPTAEAFTRRQLYSFHTTTGHGLEAFFTEEDVLVIAVCVKKEFHTIAVADAPLADNEWHMIDVVHSNAKRLVSSSQLTVYIDGRERLSAQLKYPSVSDPFTQCHIGAAHGSTQAGSGEAAGSAADSGPSSPGPTSGGGGTAGAAGNRGSRLFNPLRFLTGVAKSATTSTQSHLVVSLPAASMDGNFGVPAPLGGLLGPTCLFDDVLQANHVQALYNAGANKLTAFSADETVGDLETKMILHYNAKACGHATCVDLSSNENHGRFVGQQCSTSDIKVLFPWLEHVGKDPIVTDKRISIAPSSGLQAEIYNNLQDDWVVVQSATYTDNALEANQVAGFVTLVRNLVQSSPANQDSLVRTNAMGTLSYLLQKVDRSHIDVHLLMAIQLLVEAVAEINKTLLYHIYQFLLFDFRIWSNSLFPVRIGHIQYLSTIIKDDRRHFRKKYGVQYFLDIIRTYYSSDFSGEGKLSEEDARTIRVALLGLIKYYVFKEITFEELNQILNFVVTVKDENMISEAIDLIIALMEAPGKKDQIYLLMYEKDMAEVLYVLLTGPDYSAACKEKVLKLFSLLLKTDRVGAKSKTRLRIQEAGTYQGLVNMMMGSDVSLSMANYMLDLVLLTDTPASYNAALSIVQLLHGADQQIKLEATRRILSVLVSKPNASKYFAQQLGWQEAIVRLLILRPRPISKRGSQISYDHPSTNQEAASGNQGAACRPSALAGLAPSLLDQSAGGGAATPGALTPQFTKKRLFHDPTESDLASLCAGTAPEGGATRSAADADDAESLSSVSSADPSAAPSGSLADSASISSDLDPEARSRALGQGSLTGLDPPSISLSRATSESESISGAAEDSEASLAWRRQMGGLLTRPRSETMDSREELCQNLLLILFTVMWKGVEGAGSEAWKARGQVFAAISYTDQSQELLKSSIELRRLLNEMLLQGAIMDLKETGITNSVVTENTLKLVKLQYNFLCWDPAPPHEKYTERIIEDIMMLMDLMTVFDVDTGWREMEQLGLAILLGFAAQKDIGLCSIASARLHTLLQTRPVDKLQESCYVMGSLNTILLEALQDEGEQYNFLIPVMKALIDKCYDMLAMGMYLPGLPSAQATPSFYDDFKTYCQGQEWTSFMQKQVIPSQKQYVANFFDELRVAMNTELGESHEEMMMDSHRRNREHGESKLRFQEQVAEVYRQKASKENKRHQNMVVQMRNQHYSALRGWRAWKSFLTGERGAWSNGEETVLHWKLSPQENFSRMRPKLVINYSFDPHSDASRLRDNTGEEDGAQQLLPPIEMAKEVKVSSEDVGDDRLGDEEWNIISEASSAEGTSSVAGAESRRQEEKLVLQEECELVTIMEVVKGRLEVTTSHIYFFGNTPNREEGEDFKLSLAQLREIHFRRYNLRRSALELFLVDQTNYFLNFQKKVRNKVYSKILSLRPPSLVYYGSRSPAELLRASGLTQKWVQREISNFQYLMQLNTIAGRTYNDLSQYPVFPWVVRDYTSETLNLEDPSTYRDLSKPIGIINPVNEEEVREKYDHFEDPTGTIEKFHYGTHYSNPATVMHYLLRVEPYTTLHIQLQSGKFDVADRQFYSIANTWQGLLDNPNDVKELIPEFFYLPEFLENSNGFDLGKMQVTGEPCHNVVLPAWAKTPEDFIHKHRLALESEYVSAHLHEWIDLIFGYKQKGPAARDAMNVFYYCSYEGAVDLDAVTDPVQRKALEGMINNFGQTPCQLLKEAHPRRMTFDEATARGLRIDRCVSVLWFLDQLKAFFVPAESSPLVYVSVPRNQARSFIQHGMPDTMIGISETGIIGTHGWLPYDKSISNYFTFEKDPSLNSNKDDVVSVGQLLSSAILTPRTKKRVSGAFQPGLRLSPSMFCVTHDAKLILSAGHSDNSLHVYSVAKNKTTQYISGHTDVVTCVSLDYCGSHLVTGSRDTTCMVWEVTYQSAYAVGVNPKPLQILYGHDDKVTSVAISVELDLLVSGSKDGTVLIHTMRRGHYVRTLRPPRSGVADLVVNQLALSDVGHVVLYCTQHTPGKSAKDDQMSLHVYSINGKHLVSQTVHSHINHLVVAEGFLITGNRAGVLGVKQLTDLKTRATLSLHVEVQCVSITANNSHLLAGLKDGKLIIVGIKRPSQVK